jgi:hypothetical protein
MTPRGMDACAFCYLQHTIGATMNGGDALIAPIHLGASLSTTRRSVD